MLPRAKLEIWGLQTAGDALIVSILPSPRYFAAFTIPLGGLFWLPGGGGGCVRPTGLQSNLVASIF